MVTKKNQHPLIPLIEWAASSANNLEGEALVDFAWTVLNRYPDADIPLNHRKAHRIYLAMDDGSRLDLVEKVVLGGSETSMQTMDELLAYADRLPPLTDAERGAKCATMNAKGPRFYAIVDKYRLHTEGRRMEPPAVESVVTFTEDEFDTIRRVFPRVSFQQVTEPISMKIAIKPVPEGIRPRAAEALRNYAGWLTTDQIRRLVVEGGPITEVRHSLGTSLVQSLTLAGVDVITKDVWPEHCQPT